MKQQEGQVAEQRCMYGPSFLVGVRATILAHMLPGNLCTNQLSPAGTGARVTALRDWSTRALVCGSCPSHLVLPVKPGFDLNFCKQLMDPAVVLKYESSVTSCDFN